jgi:uncharacterized membrane protein YccF (DUF307 family)
MKTLLNVVWLILAGLWLAISYVIAAILLAITIISIPFGVADFKMAGAALVPFGKEIVKADLRVAQAQGGTV